MATEGPSEAAAERQVRYALRRRGIRCGPGRHLGAIIPRSALRRDALYELLKRALHRRQRAVGGGGDYDVVGVAEGTLLYVEVKSSAPRNIEQRQIGAFVERVAALAPNMAVLLNDTQLRMLDKLIPALRTELRRHQLGGGSLRRVQGEIFSRGDRLFVTNSEPDLVGNLGTCLARFFRARSLTSTGAR